MSLCTDCSRSFRSHIWCHRWTGSHNTRATMLWLQVEVNCSRWVNCDISDDPWLPGYTQLLIAYSSAIKWHNSTENYGFCYHVLIEKYFRTTYGHLNYLRRYAHILIIIIMYLSCVLLNTCSCTTDHTLYVAISVIPKIVWASAHDCHSDMGCNTAV